MSWAGTVPKPGLIRRRGGVGGNRGRQAGASKGHRHTAGRPPGGWHKGKSCGQWCVWSVAALLWTDVSHRTYAGLLSQQFRGAVGVGRQRVKCRMGLDWTGRRRIPQTGRGQALATLPALVRVWEKDGDCEGQQLHRIGQAASFLQHKQARAMARSCGFPPHIVVVLPAGVQEWTIRSLPTAAANGTTALSGEDFRVLLYPAVCVRCRLATLFKQWVFVLRVPVSACLEKEKRQQVLLKTSCLN